MTKKILNINPATEKVFARYDEYSQNKIDRMINMGRKTFCSWKKTGFDQRKKLFLKLADIMEKEKKPLATLMSQEMGKTLVSGEAEIIKCASVCRYYAFNAEKILAFQKIKTEASDSYVRFDPIGIILAIMPWNFPYWQVFRASAPALMSGNVMLLKHASNVSGSALAIEELYLRAGFPGGVFQTILLTSDKIKNLIENTAIAAVTFTGSEQAGSSVASNAGRVVKKSILELGGSDPFIVLGDADIKKAAITATSARLIVSGQSCIAAKRFIIEKKISAKFLRLFKNNLEMKKLGDPLDPQTDVGPLSSKQILETIEKQVKLSVSMGAKIITGGKRWGKIGYFYEPTIVTNVNFNMPVAKEETFGPVAVVFIVKDYKETLMVANHTEFGLGASVWTKDMKKAQYFIENLESGGVYINEMVKSDPRLPFGGTKKSGYGRELSDYGIKEFVNIKSVIINK